MYIKLRIGSKCWWMYSHFYWGNWPHKQFFYLDIFNNKMPPLKLGVTPVFFLNESKKL